MTTRSINRMIRIPIFTLSLLTNLNFFSWKKYQKTPVYISKIPKSCFYGCTELMKGSVLYAGLMTAQSKVALYWSDWVQLTAGPLESQTGHCYFAGRSELSLPISTVTPDESTTHQSVSAQPAEKTCAQLLLCPVSLLQSRCQSDEWL